LLSPSQQPVPAFGPLGFRVQPLLERTPPPPLLMHVTLSTRDVYAQFCTGICLPSVCECSVPKTQYTTILTLVHYWYLIVAECWQLLTFYDHYPGQPALTGVLSQELEDFVGAKFYCPHALADGS